MRFRSSGLRLAATLPVAVQAFKQPIVARRRRLRLVQHDNVEAGQLSLVAAKGLTNDSFDTVPSRGVTAVFLGYREAEPGGTRCILSAKHGEKPVSAPSCPLEHRPKVGRV
jgi:hypothetical protein